MPDRAAEVFMKTTTGSLDLKTSWGPFSPTYLGISGILNPEQGSMVDLPLFVGRRQPENVVLPDSIFDYVQNMKDGNRRAVISAIPEDVQPDYSSYAIRYFLDPHGDTGLARFTIESDARVRCDLTFHNASDEAREYFYGLGIIVSDVRPKVSLQESLRAWWIPACDYESIEAYQKTFALGCRQCLTRVFSWGVEPTVLAQAFGGWPEDRVTYRAALPKPLKDGFLYLRYVKYGTLNPAWELRINGKARTIHFPQTWVIPGGGWGKNRDAYEEWRVLRVPVGEVSETDVTLELRPLEAPGNDLSRIWLDGMLIHEGLLPGDEGELSPTTLIDAPLRGGAFVEVEENKSALATFRLSVPDEPVQHLEIAMGEESGEGQQGKGSFLAHLRKRFALPPGRLLRDENISPWASVESCPITVPPRSERMVTFTILLNDKQKKSAPASRELRIPLEGPFADMASHLGDALLFNVNYPLRLFGSPSPYYVPAKYFPIPYSWDGGFAAVGLATISPDLAVQQTAYFFAGEEHDFPFLYCGSPVPTQFYSLWDAFQATGDMEVLAKNYAGAKRMYDFFLGRTPGSVANLHNDGCISTYAYNYNLGIDDHPIQRWAEECHLTSKGLYSLILMPQVLRLARIMRNIATLLDRKADAEQYRKDAALLGEVIETRMWDEQSGLYGWLCRTENGVEPVIFDGCAGDRSACAFLPLFAGLTAHKDRLLQQMKDPARFFTPFGISSVDMQAPSYDPNGYWNGGIWPVLQWYLWRGLIEAGELELARHIADTILKTWSRFFEEDHYLGEHFMIAPEQMNGAPNFAGLSSVLLPMRAAYYAPYQVTTSYEVIILGKQVDGEKDTLSLSVTAPCLETPRYDVLINMGRAGIKYAVLLNGHPQGEFIADAHGHLEISLPRPTGHDEVSVNPI